MSEDEKCGSEDPAVPGLLCDKPPHPFGAHFNMSSMTTWAGVPMPQRKGKGPRGGRVTDLVRTIEASGNAERTGPPTLGPPKAATLTWEQRRARWLEEAKEALRQVCLGNETFTNEQVWARVDDVSERRAMVLVTRHGLRNGWMHEDHAIRVHGTWRTRDGQEFPLNKLVPVYRSDLFGQEG